MSATETVLLLHEVLAAYAHIAPHGAKTERFEIVADALNENCDFSIDFDAKRVYDRYERLQRMLNKHDQKEAMMSGVGGKMTEADESLSAVRQARKKIRVHKDDDRLLVQEREKRKIKAGAGVVATATSSGAIVSDKKDDNSERDSDGGDGAERGGDSRRKRRRTVNHSEQMKGKMDRFSTVLKQSDEAQRALKEKNMEVEERKVDAAEHMRAADRDNCRTKRKNDQKERMEEPESTEHLQMMKFRMMTEMMLNCEK